MGKRSYMSKVREKKLIFLLSNLRANISELTQQASLKLWGTVDYI